MQEKIRENKRLFNTVVTIGIVGHCPIDELSEIKKIFENLGYFDLVFFKTSSGKLWIKEGDEQ